METKKEPHTGKKDKWRVQLDFSGKALAELDELKDRLGASARADVLRDALRWLVWTTDEVDRGGTFIIERDSKQREVVFPFRSEKR